MAFELVITETDGDKRQIILRGRSKPDIADGAPEFGAQMRGRVNYAPANPVADASLVGATWLPTTFQGRWDDKFFRGKNAPEIKNFKDLASRQGFLGGFTTATAALQVVEAFTVLLRGQPLLRVGTEADLHGELVINVGAEVIVVSHDCAILNDEGMAFLRV